MSLVSPWIQKTDQDTSSSSVRRKELNWTSSSKILLLRANSRRYAVMHQLEIHIDIRSSPLCLRRWSRRSYFPHTSPKPSTSTTFLMTSHSSSSSLAEISPWSDWTSQVLRM